GLAVSRRIVEEHLGWMEAENLPPGGALFTVYVPVEAQNARNVNGETDDDLVATTALKGDQP
ncbi:MAG: hypothetical protein ACK5RS_15295, partial [Acidobacteriota bacterium]